MSLPPGKPAPLFDGQLLQAVPAGRLTRVHTGKHGLLEAGALRIASSSFSSRLQELGHSSQKATFQSVVAMQVEATTVLAVFSKPQHSPFLLPEPSAVLPGLSQ